MDKSQKHWLRLQDKKRRDAERASQAERAELKRQELFSSELFHFMMDIIELLKEVKT